MAKALLYLSPFLLIFSYVLYNFTTLTDILSEPKLLNNNCTVIRGAEGIEDIIKYKNYLIGSSDRKGDLWLLPQVGVNNTKQGSIVYLDTTNDKIRTIKINDYPEKISFHPHGIYLYQEKYLYVINHAYNRGGERIEVFELVEKPHSNLELNYLRSIMFSDDYEGIFNDLIVIGDNDEVLVTTYLPFPDSREKGRTDSLPIKIVSALLLTFKIPLTYIYHCKGAGCFKVKGSDSLMNNGITFDPYTNTVYAVNVFEKRVRAYSLEKEPEFNLKYLKDINTGYSLDNVEFDPETRMIYAGAIGRIYDHFIIEEIYKNKTKLEDVGKRYYGSLIIDTFTGKPTNTVMQNDQFVGISSAYKVGEFMYHGSWIDNGLLKCRIE